MYLRKVEGVTRMDRIPNEDIRSRLGDEAVLDMADRKKKECKKKIEEIAAGEVGEKDI